MSRARISWLVVLGLSVTVLFGCPKRVSQRAPQVAAKTSVSEEVPSLCPVYLRSRLGDKFRQGANALARKQWARAVTIFDDLLYTPQRRKYGRAFMVCRAQAWMHQGLYLLAFQSLYQSLRRISTRHRHGQELRGLLWLSEKLQADSFLEILVRQLRFFRGRTPPKRRPLLFFLNQRSTRFTRRPWWRSFRDRLAYLLGKLSFVQGPRKFRQAERLLRLVSNKAPRNRYNKALYLRGVMKTSTGRHQSAEVFFQQMMKAPCVKASTHFHSCRSLRLLGAYGAARTLYARAAIARVRYSIKKKGIIKAQVVARFARASKAYEVVRRLEGADSPQARFEVAWLRLLQGKYAQAMVLLSPLRKVKHQLGWGLERHTLESLIHFKDCRMKRAARVALSFSRKYSALVATYKRVLSYRRSKKWAEEYYDYYLAQQKLAQAKQPSELPLALLKYINSRKVIREFEGLSRRADVELRMLKAISSSVNPKRLKYYKRLLLVGKRAFRRKLGLRVYAMSRSALYALTSRLNEARILRLEALQSLKKPNACRKDRTKGSLSL